ncbi:hypothetical protein ABZ541_04855 [Micromonospora sediminicola]|uniref:hypothetical protein n=1 Tax=Micromonospora sediminicola TaxID=946078 RepID=UPI0033DB995B
MATVITTAEPTPERTLPINIITKLVIGAGIGVGGYFAPAEVGDAVGLGLVAYLVMHQVTRQIRR